MFRPSFVGNILCDVVITTDLAGKTGWVVRIVYEEARLLLRYFDAMNEEASYFFA